MKTKLLKMSMLAAVLIFVFTGASWADGRKNRHQSYAPEKRIRAKHYGVAVILTSEIPDSNNKDHYNRKSGNDNNCF